MKTKGKRTELRLTRDMRFVPAVTVAIHHAATHSRMAAQPEAGLIHAAESLCTSVLANGNGHDPCLQLSVNEFPDKVEVIMEYPGKPIPEVRDSRPQLGIPGAAGFAAPQGIRDEVDQVLVNHSHHITRVILIQFSDRNPHHS